MDIKQYKDMLAKYLRPHWLLVMVLAVLLFSNAGLLLINPQLLRQFIDIAVGSGPTAESLQTLSQTALIFLGLVLVQQVTGILVTYVSETLGWKATNMLRADLVEHCLRLDMSFHNTKTPGEMIERVDGDVKVLHKFFSQFVVKVLGSLLLLAGILIVLFREDWRVGWTFVGFILLTMLVMWWLRSVGVSYWKAARQAGAERAGFMAEVFSGTEDIRSCGAKDYTLYRFYELARALMNKTLKANLATNLVANASWLSLSLSTALALAMGAYLYQQGKATIGTVYLIYQYSTMLTWPMQYITEQMQDLQRAGSGLARILEFLRIQSQVRDNGQSGLGSGLLKPASLEGALTVSFEGVSFGYQETQAVENSEAVLRDLSFRLQPGTVLGLLGRTGSGKTTLTRLLFRFYDPAHGRICLGDGQSGPIDIRQIPLHTLRQRVGLVTQDVQLFHATVRDNLTFFDRSIPDAHIYKTIEDLGLDEWYQLLPNGLNTELGSGRGLSAGEAQILAFTRIFLRNPGVVILDEATSRLDPATEHLIERAVNKLIQQRTAIIVAHRLRTIQCADEIMILEDGRICEYGLRSSLADDPNSRFYGLLQTALEEVLA